MVKSTDTTDLARSASTALIFVSTAPRRSDLNSAYRVEVGRAYAEWFGIHEAVKYLESHSIDKLIIDRVLRCRLFRGRCLDSTSSIFDTRSTGDQI